VICGRSLEEIGEGKKIKGKCREGEGGLWGDLDLKKKWVKKIKKSKQKGGPDGGKNEMVGG